MVSYTVSRNGYSIDLSALINSGANGFTFINTSFTIKAAKFLDVKAIQLKYLIPIKGFNRELGKKITYILVLYLNLNRKR